MNLKNKNLVWWLQTAMLLALMLVFQQLRLLIGNSLVSTIIIGSLVNLSLVVAAGTVGWKGGLVLAVLSPIVALIEGHLALPVLVPFVAVGNFVIVIAFELVEQHKNTAPRLWTAVAVSSVAKFVVLYALIVGVFVGLLLPGMGLPAKNVTMMTTALSLSFSWPQLVTAAIGGAIAVPVIQRLRKIFSTKEHA